MSNQKERFEEIAKDQGNSEITENYGDGTALIKQGTITRQEYLESLKIKLSDYSNMNYTKKELTYVKKYLAALSTGSSATIPLICAGDRCPFASLCPLQQIGRAPLHKQCIPENEFLILKKRQYIEEYDVHPGQASIMSLVNELAEIDVYDMRATMTLAKEGNAEMFIDETVNITESGQTITQKRIHPTFEIKERLKSRRMKIMEVLVGTPKEKYKREAALKKVDGDDYSTTLTEVQQTLKRLQRQTDDIAFKNAAPIDAEFSETKEEEKK